MAINVGLITSFGTRCGISEYSKYLTEYAQAEDVRITVENNSIAGFANGRRGTTYDLIHVVASGFAMGGYEPHQLEILRQQTRSRKLVLTWNDCNPVDNRNDFTNRFDRVIIFEPNTIDGFDYIPLGCPVFDPADRIIHPLGIGTNGFPQERKNLLCLAEAVEAMHWNLVAFIPESPHADAQKVKQDILARNPSAIVRTEWNTNEEVLRHLSGCMATCYPYIEWINGSSSAALFAASARVSMFVSRTTQFDSLKHYDKGQGVFFIESKRPTTEEIVASFREHQQDLWWRRIRNTQQIYDKHRWDKVGRLHTQLWKDSLKE